MTLSSLWLSDPLWQAMDPTTRGFHAQLVLLALRQGGGLPDDERLWRQWLSLPMAGEAPSTRLPEEMLASLAILDASQGRQPAGEYAQALEHYWTHSWRPQLYQAWPIGKDGLRRCDLVSRLLAEHGRPPVSLADPAPASSPPEKPKKARAKPKAKSKALPLPALTQMNWDLLATTALVRAEGIGSLVPLSDKLLDVDQIKARWHLPANRSTRLNLWSVGLSVLGNAEESNKNRTFMASLIRRYGENKVAAAIGEISARSIPPADPRSFLLGILRRETEGSAGAQRARENRAGLPL